jgi:cytochrome c oxidase cbb3-type subunit 1
MSDAFTSAAVPSAATEAGSAATPAQLNFSCRLPLLVFFISAAIWLVIASAFSLIASIKFHSPRFLADQAWLTYGRVHPAYMNSVLYGFCLQAGFGVLLWLLVWLGRAPLVHRWLVTIGAMFWNLGVTVGVIGILAGDSTGFENLEMPGYAALLAFLGYLLIGVWGVITFHQRRERPLFVSQWFLFTALFWFPWIYSGANLLLVGFPLRGVAQAVVAWWYSQNLLVVWLGLVGLGTVFYFVPKLLKRELHSHYLALFTFWMLLLFAGWGGIPNTAPLPAWMPALSTVATVLLLIPLISVAHNLYRTAATSGSLTSQHLALPFILFGTMAFVLAGLMSIGGVLLDEEQLLTFTWYTVARTHLQVYGFFAMVMFGAIYYIMPQLIGLKFPASKLIRSHFWVAAAGIVLICLPQAIAGVVQAIQLLDPTIAFAQSIKTSLLFLRVSTLGDLLLLTGHWLLLYNVVGLTTRFYRARAVAAYENVTTDLFKAAEAKP